MNDFDENGWSDIHVCAANGYVKSIEGFVKNGLNVLELETADHLRLTPFLLAVSYEQQESVSCLIRLGAKVDSVNSHNFGAVEICALKESISLIQYFISLDLPALPVWRILLRMLESDVEGEAVAAGNCLRALTSQGQQWKPFHDSGGVPAVIQLARSTLQVQAKIPAFQALINVIERPEIQERLVSSGGIPAFIDLLRSSNSQAGQLSAEIIKELSKVPDFADSLVQNMAIPNLLKVLQITQDPSTLVPVVQALGNISQTSQKHQAAVVNGQGAAALLVSLFDSHNHHALSMALINAVSKIVHKNQANQTAFVTEGITQQIVNVVMTQSRNREFQASAVEVIHCLAEDNQETQNDLLDKGAHHLLMQMLKKYRSEALQEKIAMSLWAIAGKNADIKRDMASDIGVHMLIEFINSMPENLHYIGSEGLSALAQGPVNQQSVIASANGIQPLVRLLRSSQEHIVVSAIRTLRFLCAGVGCIPHQQSQNSVSHFHGIRYLVALMVHSTNELLQVEAANTLASVSLGNKKTLSELAHNVDFSYVRILKMLYSHQPIVRLMAGSALACFAFNNLQQQQEIAEQGGVRFSCFIPFLQSDDEFYRCSAAYQVVILARIIPDEAQANTSAIGIKLLVDLLRDSKSDEILALAADYVACLSHTRAGIPAAIVAINAVDYLCSLLLSSADHVRGNAAIALGYLSHDHRGERLILHRCRNDPYLMKVIKYYTKHRPLAARFTDGWLHYKKVGLPPIPEGRPSLVQQQSHIRNIQQPVTIFSLEDSSSNIQSSSSVLSSEENAGRTSRAASFRESFISSSLSMNNSRLSLTSRNSVVYAENGM